MIKSYFEVLKLALFQNKTSLNWCKNTIGENIKNFLSLIYIYKRKIYWKESNKKVEYEEKKEKQFLLLNGDGLHHGTFLNLWRIAFIEEKYNFNVYFADDIFEEAVLLNNSSNYIKSKRMSMLPSKLINNKPSSKVKPSSIPNQLLLASVFPPLLLSNLS